jgi:hypothetical protein
MLSSPALLRVAALVFALLSPTIAAASSDEVLEWNRVAADAMAAKGLDPLTESRVLAIVHLAIHDALNGITRRFEPYRMRGPVNAGASADAAVITAAHDTLVALMPDARATFDARRDESLARLPEGAGRAAGIAIGAEAAATMLAARAADGADRPVAYTPGTMPGAYRPTPPDMTPAFFPHWGRVTPFVLTSSAQFRPAPPPAPDSTLAQADVREVRAIGAADSDTRTPEQSVVARYWYENSTQGWNRIARVVAEARGLDPWESARLLALVHAAMADGFIAGFEAKYHYNYWRPATAIRAGGDTEWLSDLITPPVPDYPSTHTVLGAAAAAVLARFFETDLVAFAMTSGAPYAGITRSFWSFSQAARENGASRVLAGIHFSTAVRAGFEQGDRVGAWTFDHALRPVAAPTSRMSSR